MTISFVMDFILIAFLMATCTYCFVLHRRLIALRNSHGQLQSAINVFDVATQRAEKTLARVEQQGMGESKRLQRDLQKAERVASELSVMVSAGDSIATRIDNAMIDLRMIEKGRRIDANYKNCA